jgi:hypothetical protein
MRAMKVNHLHLIVPSVGASRVFFEKYFDLRMGGGNAGAPGGFKAEVGA